MDHRSIRTRESRQGLLTVATILATTSLAFGWTASGTVKSTAGIALPDVAVSVKDSAAYNATTSAAGTFSLGSSTGIRLESSASSKWAVRVAGGELDVRTPGNGPTSLSLVDGQGRSIWAATVIAQQGAARTQAPSGLRFGAAYLRVRQGEQEFVAAMTTGPEGAEVASHIVAPRSLATYPVLQFKKTGYRDTTFALQSEASTGLAITLAAVSDPTTCPATKLAPVDQQVRTITVKGVSRKYILHVPSTYKGDTPAPLVVDYHPIGGSAAGQFSGTQYKTLTDKEGVISVYPDGLTGPMGQAWNVKGCCSTADDTAFARAMVAEVKTLACIDPKRVYAVGFSMGGGMTHYSACNLADIFAAGAPAAFDLTQQNEPTCKPTRPLTMVLFRGTADNVVAYAGGHSALVTGMAIDFLGAKGSFKRWSELDQCTDSPSAEDANGCSTYSKCAGGVQVTLCTKQGGGHEQGNGSVGWPILKKYSMP